MQETRPDPDALLQALGSSATLKGGGNLKIFFGASPGVGKTFAMLHEAQSVRAGGTDVVAGLVETHGRSETAALLAGLEQLPLRDLEHRGVTLREFDLDAALARHPQLILVDELAHSNAEGSRHAKRWQDVEELLAAGINVFTTVNVQHLESLNDVVAQITGVVVKETIPDAILERADEVELIDISPEELLQRLQAGKVYLPEQAQRALASFFSRANLTALRELALRRTAQQVDTQLQAQRVLSRTQATWPAGERLIVCVGPGPLAQDLVRSARRMAGEMHAQWEAVYVETASGRELGAAARARLAETLRLAEALGGEAVTLSGEQVADTLVAYARQRNASKIIVGKPTHPRWLDRIRGSLVDALIRLSGDIDVYVVRAPTTQTSSNHAPVFSLPTTHSDWREYLVAVGMVVAVTIFCWFLQPHLQAANLVMLYLLGVVAVALRSGRGAAMLATVLAVAAFDFYFVPPYFTFAVSDVQYLLTFLVMLFVGLVIASLTLRLKQQVLAAVARERRASSLYRLSRDLAATQGLTESAALAEQRLGELFNSSALVVMKLADGTSPFSEQQSSQFTNPKSEQAVLQWVLGNGKAAGLGTATLPGSEALYLPLSTGRSVLGVLAVKPGAGEVEFISQPDSRHMLDTCATLVAIALDRELREQSQQQAQLQVEQERLRSALLRSISHDLRTPLAGISGSAETLASLGDSSTSTEQKELLGGIQSEAQRLTLLLENILDLTRLGAGEVKLRLEAQPLEEVVGAALESLEARLRGRELTLDIPEALPLVRIDTVLIERVLVNLLDNALRYTPAGSPLLLRARAAGDSVELALADRGPGLPPIEPELLFEPFNHVEGPGSTSAAGSRGMGLGLSICKAIVTANGGRIRAEAREGGGSVFTVSLPALRAADAVPPEAEKALA